MLRIKQHKLIWIGLIVLGVILLGMPAAVYADDGLLTIEGTADVVYYEDGDYDADSSAPPPVLGSTTEDFVYTPVTPCRIVNTWNAGGPLNTNEIRSFLVYGTGGQLAPQGGNPAGCSAPRGEPRAVHINVTVADTTASGYLSAWPFGIAMPFPRTSILNFKPGASDPICNALSVKTGYLLAKDINIYAYRETDLIVDVLGYYYETEQTQVDNYVNYATTSVPAGDTFSVFSPACPSGTRLVGGGFSGYYYGDHFFVASRPVRGTNVSFISGWNQADRYVCQGTNTTGGARQVRCFTVCARTPGRSY
jgi:hypothetical protein